MKGIPKQKEWKPWYTVSLEVRGGFKPDVVNVLPLIEGIVKHDSDSSGICRDGARWYAAWHRDGPRTARGIYRKLENLFQQVRFSYVNLRLIHHHTEGKQAKLLARYHRGKAVQAVRKAPRRAA